MPRLGAINLHGSLLPDYRGASPVQRALWDGRTTTGVTTLWMDEGIDTGDMILTLEDRDLESTTTPARSPRGSPSAARRCWPRACVLAYEGQARAARRRTARAARTRSKLRKGDGDGGLERSAAIAVWNHQRAVTPWPGAITMLRGESACGSSARTWRATAGRTDEPGTVLGPARRVSKWRAAPGVSASTRIKPQGRGAAGRGRLGARRAAFAPASASHRPPEVHS